MNEMNIDKSHNSDYRKISYDIAYMKMALAMSELSYAIRHKVGAIIVSKDGQVISQGYNGTPAGFDNCCEDVHCSCDFRSFNDDAICCFYDEYSRPVEQVASVSHCLNLVKENFGTCKYMSLITKPEVLHAESNAITKCAKWTSTTEGATLYVTLSPCMECSKLIVQSGINRVVFLERYHTTSGIEVLNKAGIVVEQIDIDNHSINRISHE